MGGTIATPPLIRAVLDGRHDLVREIAASDPSALADRTSTGDLPLELARKAGRIREEVTLTRYGAPGASRSARELLLDLIAFVSHDALAAHWPSSFVEDLGRLVRGHGITPEEPLDPIPPELEGDRRWLAERTDGWWPEASDP